uniref:Uncharacterized protein n=1 Tax=Arundo donax TaxID=35708 RepID=A0A0A8ZY52_ARUDO
MLRILISTFASFSIYFPFIYLLHYSFFILGTLLTMPVSFFLLGKWIRLVASNNRDS